MSCCHQIPQACCKLAHKDCTENHWFVVSAECGAVEMQTEPPTHRFEDAVPASDEARLQCCSALRRSNTGF